MLGASSVEVQQPYHCFPNRHCQGLRYDLKQTTNIRIAVRLEVQKQGVGDQTCKYVGKTGDAKSKR